MVLGEKISTKWLRYDVDGEILQFKIRFLSQKKIQELSDTDGDDQKKFEAILDYFLIDWDGIDEKPGVKAECSFENKIRLSEYLPEICGRAGFLIGAAQQDITFMVNPGDMKKKFEMALAISGNGEKISQNSTAESV